MPLLQSPSQPLTQVTCQWQGLGGWPNPAVLCKGWQAPSDHLIPRSNSNLDHSRRIERDSTQLRNTHFAVVLQMMATLSPPRRMLRMATTITAHTQGQCHQGHSDQAAIYLATCLLLQTFKIIVHIVAFIPPHMGTCTCIHVHTHSAGHPVIIHLQLILPPP